MSREKEILEAIKWKRFEDMTIAEKCIYQDLQKRKSYFDSKTEDENFKEREMQYDADHERNVMYREV